MASMAFENLHCVFRSSSRGGVRTVPKSASAEATARRPSLSSTTRAKTGGKGIRTPDLLIANETLYQLSYTPHDGMQASMMKKFVQQRGTLSPLLTDLVRDAKIGWKKRASTAHRGTRTMSNICRANTG